jgi:predicted DNA-binding antitoxin AbrB/MazE fold protein
MPKSVRAIFQKGILRPLGGLELPENMEVCIQVSEPIGSTEPASLIDTDFLADCRDELAAGDIPTLEEARRILSKVPGSLVPDFAAEREER